jgi:mRNA interferase RelE/StbE
MSWTIEIKPSAEKSYHKLTSETKRRIRQALEKIEQAKDPFSHPGVKTLVGPLKGDYRVRVGDWRILFTPDHDNKILHVYAILPRASAYKK